MLPGGNSPSDVFFLLLLVQSFSAITSDTSPHQMSARSFPLKKAGRRRPGAGNYYVRTPTADFKLSQRCQEVGLRMGPLRAGGFAAAGAVLGTLGTTSVSAALGSVQDCGSHIPSLHTFASAPLAAPHCSACAEGPPGGSCCAVLSSVGKSPRNRQMHSRSA